MKLQLSLRNNKQVNNESAAANDSKACYQAKDEYNDK